MSQPKNNSQPKNERNRPFLPYFQQKKPIKPINQINSIKCIWEEIF